MDRWAHAVERGSPVFVAGESYGGFRAAKMARVSQQDTGVGLNGTILISPALEFGTFSSTDYDMLGWVDRLPTMALAAAHHGKSWAFSPDDDQADVRAAAKDFATGDYTTFLARGAAMPADQREAVLTRLADLIGIDRDVVERSDGRIGMFTFIREMMRSERKVLGLYGATVTAVDPFPDREPFPGPDPTLAGFGSAFTAAVNRMIRTEIGVESERDYRLLSYEVNTAWKIDGPRHALAGQVGATDDFRYGMSLNSHLKSFVTHGYYDLVTPCFGSDRLLNLMRLDPSVAARITTKHFGGGHMFYAWEDSRIAFRDAIAEFVADAL
jgi:carboxypeptidase C (cathepsin A)